MTDTTDTVKIEAVNNQKKTAEEQLAALEKKMAQLKAQKQKILSREKEQARKARTHRLVQIGALAETHLKCEGVQPEEFKEYIVKVAALVDRERQKQNGQSAAPAPVSEQ